VCVVGTERGLRFLCCVDVQFVVVHSTVVIGLPLSVTGVVLITRLRTQQQGEAEGGVPSGQASTLGLLFFKFIRAQPYTCLGIEWLTQGGVVYYFHVFIRAQSYTCLGIDWLTQAGGVVYYFSCVYKGPTLPVWELIG